MLAYMLVCATGMFLFAILNPIAVWDMLGYAATVYSLGGANPTDIHSEVYLELKTYTSAEIFHELTMGSSYRHVMFNDADAFIQQMHCTS